jgi:hypothetical protein
MLDWGDVALIAYNRLKRADVPLYNRLDHIRSLSIALRLLPLIERFGINSFGIT